MFTHSAVFEVDDLKDFLVKKKNISSSIFKELLVSLFIAKFHSKIEGEEFLIGIPVKRDKNQVYQEANVSFEEVLKGKEDYSPIDFFVIKRNDFKKRENRKGFAYQLKRFPTLKNKDDITEDLLTFLRVKIPQKYSFFEEDIMLLIYIGADMDRVNLKKLESFSPQRYPFKSVGFISKRKNKLVFCRVWPELMITEINPLGLLA